MTTPKRRYIDELLDLRFSSGGPVSISLETAKRLRALYMDAGYVVFRSQELDEDIPEPKP